MVVATIVLGLAIVIGVVAYPELSAKEAQAQLLTYAAALEPGFNTTQARRQFDAGRFTMLRLYESPKAWTVHTPHRFGARNWMAFIDFESDVVRCIRVRLSDSAYVRPDAAPQDRCGKGEARSLP